MPEMEYEPKMKLKIKKTAMIMYPNCPRIALVFSERLECLILKTFRMRVIRSWYKPNGQSQPQKNLPRTIDIVMTKPKTMASFSRPDVE